MQRRRTPRSDLWSEAASRPLVEPILVDERRAAEMLGICQRTLHTLQSEGLVPARAIPGMARKLFHVDDLRAYARDLPPYEKPTRPNT
jgi:hypothetical protein